MAQNKHHESCTLSDLAKLMGMDREMLYALLKREDLHRMIDLGWQPFRRRLPPSVVGFLREKFIDSFLPFEPHGN